MTSRSEAFFKEAEKNLQIAKDELFKPEEDLVSYSICKNAQFAIENYLKGYLVRHDVHMEPDETIQSLYDKCLGIDPNFKKIDLHSIACKGHVIDSRYCSDVESVSACYDAADSIDTLLRKKKLL